MGGPSVPSNQKTTTTNKIEFSPEQKRLLDLAFPKAESFAFNGVEQYPNFNVAGFNPLQEFAQQSLVNQAQGPIANTAANADLAQNFAMGPILFPSTNPALADATNAAVRPLTEAFTQQVLPNIRSTAGQLNQYGSSRQGVAEGIATGNYLRSVGDTSANVANEGYQKGLDAYIKGLALAPNTAQLQTLPSSLLDVVGGSHQELEQARLNADQQRYMEAQLLDLIVAQELTKLAGAFGGESATSTVNQPTGVTGPGMFQKLLGGASAGLAIGGAIPGFAMGGPIGAGIGAIGSLIFA